MWLCQFGHNPPIGSGDSADKKLCRRRQDLHQKQYGLIYCIYQNEAAHAYLSFIHFSISSQQLYNNLCQNWYIISLVA